MLNSLLSHSVDFDDLAENAAKVAHQNFKWQHITLIIFNATIVYGVNTFVKIYNKNVELFNELNEGYARNSSYFEETTQFVLFVNDNDDALSILKTLKRENFNSNGKFIFVCRDRNNCRETETVEILWKYNIMNVVLIKYTNSQVTGYTYDSSPDCGPSIPFKINNWADCIRDYEVYSKRECKKSMYPVKYRNFYRCPLIVSTYEQLPYMYIEEGVPYGADGELLRTIVEALNATLVLVSPRFGDGWGSLQRNNSWSGSLGDLYNNLANISMTSASITLARFQSFDISMHYNTIELVWVTHPSDFEPSSLKLLKPFTIKARILVVSSFFFLLFIYVMLKTKLWKIVSKKFRISLTNTNFLMYLWRISMGQQVFYRSTNVIYNNLILFWIWYFFMVRTLYQVYLIHALQTDVRISDIDTIQNAIAEGYQYGSGSGLMDYYIDDPRIYNNWQVVDTKDIFLILKDLSNGMKFVLGMNYVTVTMFKRATHMHLHVLREKILSSHTVMYFTKYSRITRCVNSILTSLFEAGIAGKIFEDYTLIKPEPNMEFHQKIKLEHFKGCFALLMLGGLLSCIFFVIEIVVDKRDKKLNTRARKLYFRTNLK